MSDAQHPTILNTGHQYLGTVYAKALIGAAEKAGVTDRVVAELDSLVSDVLARLPSLTATLESPKVPFDVKSAMLDKAFRGKMSDETLHFLKVLTRRGRFDCIRAVRQAVRKIVNDLRGRIEVLLTSAQPIDAATRDLVVAKLRTALGREIDLRTKVDPHVLGGMVLRVGDTVYDGSLANQLSRLRTELVAAAGAQLRADASRFSVAN